MVSQRELNSIFVTPVLKEAVLFEKKTCKYSCWEVHRASANHSWVKSYRNPFALVPSLRSIWHDRFSSFRRMTTNAFFSSYTKVVPVSYIDGEANGVDDGSESDSEYFPADDESVDYFVLADDRSFDTVHLKREKGLVKPGIKEDLPTVNDTESNPPNLEIKENVEPSIPVSPELVEDEETAVTPHEPPPTLREKSAEPACVTIEEDNIESNGRETNLAFRLSDGDCTEEEAAESHSACSQEILVCPFTGIPSPGAPRKTEPSSSQRSTLIRPATSPPLSPKRRRVPRVSHATHRRQRRVIRCIKTTITFFFSQVGLCVVLAAYIIAGGFLFRALEKANEEEHLLTLKERVRLVESELVAVKQRFDQNFREYIERERQMCKKTTFKYAVKREKDQQLQLQTLFDKWSDARADLEPLFVLKADTQWKSEPENCTDCTTISSQHYNAWKKLRETFEEGGEMERLNRSLNVVRSSIRGVEKAVEPTVWGNQQFIANLTRLIDTVSKATHEGWSVSKSTRWTFAGALLFSVTVITSIGEERGKRRERGGEV